MTSATLNRDRKMIRNSLPDIAAQVHSRLVGAGLTYPVYLAVPNSGDSLLSFATPLDPSDDEWRRMNDIVRNVVGAAIGAENLRSNPLACAMTGTAMGSAGVVAADPET